MMWVLHRMMALGLVVSLALTGVSAAVARGHAPAVALVEICHGLTVVTVAVDADGQPVSPVQLCPDGALALFSSEGGAGAPLRAPEAVWVDMERSAQVMHRAGQHLPNEAARGPPAVV